MDEEGYFYVIDRKKDMVVSGGENIYPREVEAVLFTHPDIVDAAVVGVPDLFWGESVKAFVVRGLGSTLDAEGVVEYCKSRLASYKKPKFVKFVDVIPRNPAGKALKKLLRDRK
jgi:acyl-CoA synthetase (AMP-forming)/AMP-acid ligase II